MKNNRKGQVFVVMVIICVTGALIAATIILHTLFKETNPDQFLGRYQSAIIDAMNDGDKIMLYLDESTKIAVTNAFDEYLYGNPNPLTNVEGGDLETKYCGSYVYRLWNTLSENCYPDYTSPDFELNAIITNKLSRLTKNQVSSKDNPKTEQYFDSLIRQDVNYRYSYTPMTGYTNVLGNTEDQYVVNIFKNRETAINEGVQSYIRYRSGYSGSLMWPLDNNYYVESCFGYRGNVGTLSGTKASSNHPGLDIPAPKGTPVLAAAPGTVEKILYPAWGKVVIDHGGGLRTAYMHMDSIAEGLQVGSLVAQGQVIGYVGGRGATSANAYGNHLHFEVLSSTANLNINYDGVNSVIATDNGNFVNPICFIDKNINGFQDKIAFNMDSRACNDICNKDGSKCTQGSSSDPAESPPYKFCNVYEGVILQKEVCLKNDKTDWDINNMEVSQAEFTSDQTLKITISIENKATTCVNLRPELNIFESSSNSRTEIMNPAIESINVNPRTDGAPFTEFDITCTFTTDKDVFLKAIDGKKCVLYAPSDGTVREYSITALMTDYNDLRKAYSKDLKFTVKKGTAVASEEANNIATDQQVLLKEYNDIKADISYLQLRELYPGEAVLIAVGTVPQKMYLVKGTPDGGVYIEKTYDVSLSQKGFGSELGSNRTPLGLHIINEKNGGTVAKDTILTNGGTVPQGIAQIYTDDTNVEDDFITSRVLRLDGVEASNKNSYYRGIYIHGTPEEGLIGTPQSHGCIRMRNQDVINLFDTVDSGTYVYIVPSLSSKTNSQTTTSSTGSNNVNMNSNNIQTYIDQMSNSDKAKLEKTKQNLNNLGIMDYITTISQKEDVPRELVLALITVESTGDDKIVSPTGAYGLFQVIKSYHEDRIVKECKSWENFKVDAECQVRVGIGIMKAYHTQYGTKGIHFQCSCDGNVGTNDCKDVDVTYIDWEAAIRAYNSANCDSASSKKWADYNFVDTVLKYAAGWGYIDATDNMIKNEIYAGILGKYYVNPKFNVKMDMDMTLFDILQVFAKDTVSSCGLDGIDKEKCTQDKLDAFNTNLPQQYKDIGVSLKTSCDSDNMIPVNKFVEEVNDCMSSPDDLCRCVFTNSNPYMELQSIESVEGSTKVSYYLKPDSDEIVDAFFDYSIMNGKEYWSNKTQELKSISLYKNKTQLFINYTSEGEQNCGNVKSAYRFCLLTRYDYNIYDNDSTYDKIKEKYVTIPFAIMIRDTVAPKPITGLEYEIMLHSNNSIILKWNAGSEGDIVRYNVYLSDNAADFSQPTGSLKSIAKYKIISSKKKDYIAYESIDFSNPICIITEDAKTGVTYCKFNYTAVDNGKTISIELEKEKLYYVSNEKMFIYILSGQDKNNTFVSDTEKFVAVTAVDIDGNEINNVESDQQINTETGNLINVTPENKLEPGFVQVTSQSISVDRKRATLMWDAVDTYIDNTPIIDMTDMKYDIHILDGACAIEQLNDIDESTLDQTVSTTDILLTLNQPDGGIPMEYCIYVLSNLTNNKYMKGFAINTRDIPVGMPFS